MQKNEGNHKKKKKNTHQRALNENDANVYPY